jgi:hypothetical protein
MDLVQGRSMIIIHKRTVRNGTHTQDFKMSAEAIVTAEEKTVRPTDMTLFLLVNLATISTVWPQCGSTSAAPHTCKEVGSWSPRKDAIPCQSVNNSAAEKYSDI